MVRQRWVVLEASGWIASDVSMQVGDTGLIVAVMNLAPPSIPPITIVTS